MRLDRINIRLLSRVDVLFQCTTVRRLIEKRLANAINRPLVLALTGGYAGNEKSPGPEIETKAFS